jgi:DNA-binding IclR family transcriptional regulator
MPFLVELRNLTRGTVSTALLVEGDAVYVDRIDGDDVGGVYRDARRVHPALSCAAGRLLAAHAQDEVWKTLVAEADDPPSAEDREAWCLAKYLLVDDVGTRGQTEIAAAVRDVEGTVRAAVTVTGEPQVFTREHLESAVAPNLLRAVKVISWGLGGG